MSKRLKLSSHSLKLDFSTTSSLASFNKPEVKQENKSLEKKTKLESENKSDNMLFCIDFDKTMVKGSLDDDLGCTFKERNECVDIFLANETKSWKNKEQLVALLKKASDLGKSSDLVCHIAIVSFGSYPKEIGYALTKLGLKQDTLEKIHVVSYCPNNKDEMFSIGKQNHIKEAMKHFNVCDNKKVVLIDDDLNNVDKALKDEMHAIHVAKDNTEYLDQAFKILEETQKATNQPSECTVSQDSLDQSTSTDSGLELLGELTSDSGM